MRQTSRRPLTLLLLLWSRSSLTQLRIKYDLTISYDLWLIYPTHKSQFRSCYWGILVGLHESCSLPFRVIVAASSWWSSLPNAIYDSSLAFFSFSSSTTTLPTHQPPIFARYDRLAHGQDLRWDNELRLVILQVNNNQNLHNLVTLPIQNHHKWDKPRYRLLPKCALNIL